jgi:predicted DNA-binding transcriptional regulator AlpA
VSFGFDPFLTSQEVADRYGFSQHWVYRCKDLRKLAVKIGKRLLWRESDLLALEEYRSGPGHKGQNLQWRRELIETDPLLIRRLTGKHDKAVAKAKLLFDIVD